MSAPLDSQGLGSQELKELAAGYVLGDLSSAEAELFHQLIQDVPALSIEVAALQETLHMIPYGLPEQQPRGELRSQTITAIQSAMTQSATVSEAPSAVTPVSSAFGNPSPSSPSSFNQQRLRRRQSRVLGSVAASLLLALGVGGLHQRLQPGVQPVAVTQVEQVWSGFHQLLEDHRSAISNPEGPADFAVAQPEDVLAQLTHFQTQASALPMLPESQAKLLGASNCQFEKTLGLRLSFQINDYPDKSQVVSAYQLDLNGEQFPQFVSSTITLRQRDGTSVVLWREESYLYALVAELPSADLDRLAHSVGQI